MKCVYRKACGSLNALQRLLNQVEYENEHEQNLVLATVSEIIHLVHQLNCDCEKCL